MLDDRVLKIPCHRQKRRIFIEEGSGLTYREKRQWQQFEKWYLRIVLTTGVGLTALLLVMYLRS